MPRTITINEHEIERIVYRDEPVVTLPMVAKLHDRTVKSVWKNFSRKKEIFVENKDYVRVPYKEWSQILNVKKSHGGHRTDMIFIFQCGYLLLVKMFRDDLAWKVQQKLGRCYFIKPSLARDIGKLLSNSIHRNSKSPAHQPISTC